MPKLSADVAAEVEKAEGQAFEVIDEGIYRAVLEGEVEVKEGANGIYWRWVFKLTDEGFTSRKMFLNTSLSEAARWRLNEVFKAFGVPADTDTDELIGKPVRLYVIQRIIKEGTRKGDLSNDIKQVLPAEDSASEDAAPATAGSGSKSKPEEVPLY